MKEMTFEQYIKTDEESTDIILDNMSLHIEKIISLIQLSILKIWNKYYKVSDFSLT